VHRFVPRAFFVAAALFASTARAQLLMDTSANVGDGRARLGGALSLSEIAYDVDPVTRDIDRTTLGATFDYGVTREVDLTAQLGFIVETDLEDVDDDGDGFTYGLGIRATVHRPSPRARVGIYGLFDSQNEEIKDGSTKYKIKTSELHLGGLFAYAISPKVEPYAGVEIVAHDDGEVKVSSPAGGGSTDIDRDDILNLKLGISAAIGSADLRGELTLVGEQTFTIGAGFYL
jgi:hypothetical protein